MYSIASLTVVASENIHGELFEIGRRLRGRKTSAWDVANARRIFREALRSSAPEDRAKVAAVVRAFPKLKKIADDEYAKHMGLIERGVIPEVELETAPGNRPRSATRKRLRTSDAYRMAQNRRGKQRSAG